MTIAEAIEADCQERLEDAAALYERALAQEQCDATIYWNLAVLYWEATDFGCAAHLRLPHTFVDLANQRWRDLVTASCTLHAGATETEFWSRYIGHLEWDEPALSAGECEEMLRTNPNNLEPALIIIGSTDNTFRSLEDVAARREKYWPLEKALEAQCAKTPTTRKRYIRSVLGGIVARRDAKLKQRAKP